VFEGTIGYELPFEKCPISLSWNTMFAGADYKPDGKRAYSTYIMAAYPFAIKTVDLSASIGMTPWESIYADGAALVHVGLKASKEIKITDNFGLTLSSELIANPKSEDIFFVFGVSMGI